ncbi:MAG: Flp pilus assembly protein CpaB [Maioricimonas sp. JB049]
MKRLTPAMLTVIMLLVVGGLVTAYVAKNLLARDETPPEDPVVNVPMAIANLEPGTVITEAHLALGPARRSGLDREVVRSNRVLVGRVVRNGIKAAEPIRTTDLYPPGEYPPLEIAEGMRAVSIGLGDGSAVVDGLVRPGQYVDVHFTPESYPDDDYTGGLTMTLFKGVKVLAINRASRAGSVGRGSNSVTLELTREQANILILAKQKGALQLTYTPEGAGTGGVAVSDEDRATFDEILGLDPPEPPEEPTVTEIYSGTGRRVLSFRKGRRTDDYDVMPYDWSDRRYQNSYGGRGRYRGASSDSSAPADAGSDSGPSPAGGAAGRDAGASPDPTRGRYSI